MENEERRWKSEVWKSEVWKSEVWKSEVWKEWKVKGETGLSDVRKK